MADRLGAAATGLPGRDVDRARAALEGEDHPIPAHDEFRVRPGRPRKRGDPVVALALVAPPPGAGRAAGLLRGKRATSHWYTKDVLPLFGAIPTEGRVVEDGRVITGGGVTAGLDFGLTISARLRGDDWARRTQLLIECNPRPPFERGTPEKSGPEITREILTRRAPEARAAAERAGARLRG